MDVTVPLLVGTEAAAAAVAYMIGVISGVTRVRREKPPVQPKYLDPDPAPLHPVCPACGGEWEPWSAARWETDADRCEQRRTCKACRLAQRRGVRR